MTQLQTRFSVEEFTAIFARLASQLRWLDYRPEDLVNYSEALRNLPIAVLHESAKRIATEPGRKYFPTTGEWREWALEYESELRRAALTGSRDWKVECEDCDDCGFLFFECPGDKTCDRDRPHLPHTFVRVCGCRESNRTYQRHHPSKAIA